MSIESVSALALLEDPDSRSLEVKVDEEATSVVYTGWAESGSATSASVWLIKRVTSSGNVSTIEWASTRQDKIWDSRATYFGAVPFSNTKSMDFDGVNDYVLVSDHADFNFGSAMTASCWIKGNAQTNANYFAHWDAGLTQRSWRMRSSSGAGNNKLEIVLSDDGTSTASHVKLYLSSVVVLNGTWNHIAFTWSSGTLKLYINGTEDTSVTKTVDDAITSLHNSTAGLTIGSALTTGAPLTPFAGNLDENNLFNVELSATDITNIYNSGNPDDLSAHAKYGSAVAWWRMGDGMDSSTVPDEKNSHDGTMTNMNYPADIETDVP